MTTTPELKIEPKLPVLSFNFDQLKTWAKELTSRYANLVVTEDAIADVKRDMAELNKAKKAVDDARKEAVRRVSEPIRAFESQIKEVCGIFDSAYAALGSQVKAFEDKQRDEKRKAVFALIEQELEANQITMEIPVRDTWLNKSASMKSIREDVAAIIEKEIENRRAAQALEQARQDRAAAIESHVKALNQQHGLELPVHRFMTAYLTDMSVSLEHAHRRINDVFANEVELRQAEESARKTLVSVSERKAAPVEQPAPKTEQQSSPAQTRAMSIVLEYDVANEARVKTCLENLKALCVNFGARYR